MNDSGFVVSLVLLLSVVAFLLFVGGGYAKAYEIKKGCERFGEAYMLGQRYVCKAATHSREQL